MSFVRICKFYIKKKIHIREIIYKKSFRIPVKTLVCRPKTDRVSQEAVLFTICRELSLTLLSQNILSFLFRNLLMNSEPHTYHCPKSYDILS